MMDRLARADQFRVREDRIAALEAMEREDKRKFGADRSRERPLRVNSKDATEHRESRNDDQRVDKNSRQNRNRLDVFQTQEE